MSRKNKQIQLKTTQRVPKKESLKNRSRSEGAAAALSWRSDMQISAATGIFLLALYIRTLHPSVPGGDSGELIISAHEFGVAHPPGYPLFTVAAKLAMSFIPSGNPAWRVNLLNAIFSAAAGALLQLTCLRLTGSIMSSLFPVALFSLSQLTWTWSVTAEVFGLNNLFVALLLLVTVQFEKVSDQPEVALQMAKCGAFICGLALCNQHTIVLYVICLAVWVLLKLWKVKVLSLQVAFSLGLNGCLGLLPYLYLPFSSFMGLARWTWGDHRTLEGFITHLLRVEYGTFDLGKDQEGVGLLDGLIAYGEHLWTDLRIVGPLLAIIGLIITIRKSASSPPTVVPLMLVVYISFFTWRANLDLNSPLFKGVVERFWMQSDMVIALLAGVGYHTISKRMIQSFCGAESKSSSSVILGGVGTAVIMFLQLHNLSVCDQSGNTVIHEFAQTLLNSIPKHALVFTKGDLPTNSLRYLHLCENVRPDLQILDQEILTYKWSLPMIGKHFTVTFPGQFWHLTDDEWPDGKRSFTFQTLLDTNYDRYKGVFVCIGMQDHDDSWQKGYQLWPHGPCHRVVRHGTPMDPGGYAHDTAQLAYSWNHTHDSFSETSWEKVANDEMWHAKIGTAFFLYQQAVAMKDGPSKVHLLLNSYKVYSESLVHHQKLGFPSFWHKNYALVCEKLLHMEHQISKPHLVDQAVAHFMAYLVRSPDDPDNEKIQDAIRMLQDRKKVFENLQAANKQAEETVERLSNVGWDEKK